MLGQLSGALVCTLVSVFVRAPAPPTRPRQDFVKFARCRGRVGKIWSKSKQNSPMPTLCAELGAVVVPLRPLGGARTGLAPIGQSFALCSDTLCGPVPQRYPTVWLSIPVVFRLRGAAHSLWSVLKSMHTILGPGSPSGPVIVCACLGSDNVDFYSTMAGAGGQQAGMMKRILLTPLMATHSVEFWSFFLQI